MGKSKRKSISPQELIKSRQAGKMKKISYLVERSNTVEFNIPPETAWNRSLANHRPLQKIDSSGKADMAGNLGKVTRFFVPIAEMKKVRLLFEEFRIPEHLHDNLIWSYLNMAFAASEASASDQEFLSIDHNLDQLNKTLDFLKEVKEQNLQITYVQMEAVTTTKNKNFKPGKKQVVKMSGRLDIGFMEDVLALCEKVEAFESLNAFHEIEKKNGKPDLHMGHKNSMKHAQSYYSRIIFRFLNKTLFESLGTLFNDLPALKSETTRLKKFYPDRQIYNFIGRLMELSGLLQIENGYPVDSLIDLIKKKVVGKNTNT